MGRFSNLEEGYYKAVILTWGFGRAQTGTPQMAYTCKLLSWKDDAGNWVELDEEPQRTVYRYLTDNTADRFCADLKTLGYDRQGFGALNRDADDAFDFEGIKVELYLSYEEYNGKERERWDFAWNYGGGLKMGKPMERKEVAALNAKYAERLRGVTAAPAAAPAAKPGARKKGKKAAPDESPEAEDNEGKDDDIPF